MEHFNPILGHETTGQKFITCGEIMLRLTPPNYEKLRMASNFEASYGGSEANIALALANLGVDSTFFSVVPNNSLGKSAVRWLRSNDDGAPARGAGRLRHRRRSGRSADAQACYHRLHHRGWRLRF